MSVCPWHFSIFASPQVRIKNRLNVVLNPIEKLRTEIEEMKRKMQAEIEELRRFGGGGGGEGARRSLRLRALMEG